MNESMQKTAEPIIENAIKDIEHKMREKMAQNLIALIEETFSVERMGRDLKIIVKQALK
jgi:hypothetical protein